MTRDEGYLLTRQVVDNNDHLEIILWIKAKTTVYQLIITTEQAIFFVANEDVPVALAHLQAANIPLANVAKLAMKTFQQQAVTGFYFNTLQHFYLARARLAQINIRCYENDIRPDERFLMERFITSGVEFTGECHAKQHYVQVTQLKCRQQTVEVALRMISIDIECSMQGELYSIAAYSDECQIVFMIGAVQHPSTDTISIVWVADERQLLSDFFAWLMNYDPDVIIGWNVINFDLDLLQKRSELHQLAFNLGRDGSKVRWRKNKTSEQRYIDIAGRAVLDGIDLLKTATYNFASFALDHVAQQLLGQGKLIDDVDNRVLEITEKFYHNKLALAEYNLADCRLVWQIFQHTRLLEFAQLRAQLTGLAIDRVGGSVAAFTNLYLPKLHRSGYVAPNMGDGESDLISPGGYVMDSIPGLYSNVLVFDFKSLYPSIIRTFCIDPMGLIEGLKDPEHSIPAFDGAYFSRTEHFLPEIINQLWQARDQAKRDSNAALSQAIKIIMNSFYGVLGSTGCRFFDPRLSGAITKRGHEILKTTAQWLMAKFTDYQVIYGDTDSIFVHINEQSSAAECDRIGNIIQQFLNQQWTAYLHTTYQINSKLEIEFEQHFSQFLMPTIRGLEIGTKKRYAGLVERNGEQQLVFKGLESVRTDWTELSKQFQQTLYLKVFNKQPVDKYIQDIVLRTKQGEFDALLVYRKRLRRKLSHYVKNVPPHVKAARLADQYHQQLGKPLKYQNKGWIEYLITRSGPQAKECLTAPLDYDHYISRQLATVADAILPFIGTTFDNIVNLQLDLFD